MKIPTKIDVLGEEFVIKIVDDISTHLKQLKVKSADDTSQYYGYFNLQSQSIFIDGRLTKRRQEQVLLHEVMEILTRQLVIKISHDDLERMEHGLFYVLKKNKLLKE